MDATAARGAFLILKKYCTTRGISIVFANVLSSICNLLLKYDVASDESFFPTANAAIELCESHLVHGVVISSKDSIERESIRLQCLVDAPGASQSLTDIDQFFRKREIPLGCEFFHVTEPSNSFFLLANDRGSVSVGDSSSINIQLKTILPGAKLGNVAFLHHSHCDGTVYNI
ncbi:hypothetical protein DVH05_024792 [Phytophthora capsici]|nr:hypothetical protein DVH05_008436 [Phytophthora capsici]KAG1699791.1 hypothetical protein DVH05_012684 [Phytophthora capsici]KAG1708108.1 hypothetical protein DVH05_024792 [Phytophthora capsici]